MSLVSGNGVSSIGGGGLAFHEVVVLMLSGGVGRWERLMWLKGGELTFSL